jgi:uncharacterized NAD(P)/FAD-binding protein YdhS
VTPGQDRPTHVAVIGAGAAGALQAIHLRRAGVARVTLIERALRPGRGVAYGTRQPEHLLNVPARRMSAYSDDPAHFVRWLEARTGSGGAEAFAPRMTFGDYLSGELAAAGSGVEVVTGEAVDVSASNGAELVRLADGRAIAADAVIFAPGNLQPAVPGPIETGALGAAWIGDPWSEALTRDLAEDAPIVLIGSGLTAVDVALTLDTLGHRGPILALSRRGLLPRAHGPREPADGPAETWPNRSAALLHAVRRRGDAIGWRSAVQEVRSAARAIWCDAVPAERARFLRHLRPWWDVHRHRVAPAVGAAIDRLQAEGRFAAVAGRIIAIEADPAGAVLRWRRRGSDDIAQVKAARIVNCTGPELDLARAGEPLFDALLAAGRVRTDSCRLGLDVDRDCRLLDRTGAPAERLFAIGPITRGAFWESIAVPDIRAQAEGIAQLLAG